MTNELRYVKQWLKRTKAASQGAYGVLSSLEQSRTRVITLEKLLKKLSGLPVDVHDYFREATDCLHYGLTRAAVVLSWAGFFHVLSERMFMVFESKLRKNRPKWKFTDLNNLKEKYPEAQILDAIKDIGFIKKNELRIFQGQLTTRNNCAHPTLYKPSMNSALGFVDDIIRQTTKYI